MLSVSNVLSPTVKFTYSQHSYSEQFFLPIFYLYLFDIKKYCQSENGYKELLLIRNSFLSPNLVKKYRKLHFYKEPQNICYL
jgi:hypothetical protein